MLERAVDIDRVLRLRKLIARNDAERLAAYVRSQVESGLLDDEVLDAARALQANAVVLYLATLGAENLPPPNDRAQWLGVYQALLQGSDGAALKQLDDRLPLKHLAQEIGRGEHGDPAALKARLAQCECAQADIDAALTFAFDQRRLDLAQWLIESLRDPSTTMQAWVHITQVLESRYTLYGEGIVARTGLAELAACFDLPLAQLPDVAQVASVKSLLALRSAQVYLLCGDPVRAVERCGRCTDPQDRPAVDAVMASAAALDRVPTRVAGLA